MGLNYLSISKRQRLHRWSLEWISNFIPHFMIDVITYLSLLLPPCHEIPLYNNCDVIMSAMACQITSLTAFYSNVYSDADQAKHQSSASLAFVWGIQRWPVNSQHKWPETRKMFPFDDVIMLLYHLQSLKQWRYILVYTGPELGRHCANKCFSIQRCQSTKLWTTSCRYMSSIFYIWPNFDHIFGWSKDTIGYGQRHFPTLLEYLSTGKPGCWLVI